MDQATLLLDGFTLTEVPRWHGDRLWFGDLYNQRVCSCTESGADLRVEVELPGIPAGMGWLPDNRFIVVVQGRNVILRLEPDGSLVQHADLSKHAVGFANDMAVTASGTAFVGCFGFDLYAGEPVKPGPLMRVTPDGEVSIVGEPLWFANGPTLIDGSTLVIAESFANRMSAFDLLENDEISERRDWATFAPMPTSTVLEERYGEAVVAADGISDIDAEGAIWVGDFTKTMASRVLPGGKIAQQVSTGDRNCFAVALGGADGHTLFMCVAPPELESETPPSDPLAAVLAYRKENPRGAIMTYRVAVPAAGA